MRSNHFAATLGIAILAGAITISSYSAQDPPRKITVEAKRYQFTPSEIDLKKNVPVVIEFTSKDVDHGLVFDDLALTAKIGKGKTIDVPFTPTEAGTFVGQCSSFCGEGHGSMKLTIHVTE